MVLLTADNTPKGTPISNAHKKEIPDNCKVAGRNFNINNFYEGITRFNFNDLCDVNLGGEDYINIAKFCNHIFIENIPGFNENNSNQQLRFIILIDIFYEKKISLSISIEKDLKNLGSSKKHSEAFKRTLSRLYEMTKIN